MTIINIKKFSIARLLFVFFILVIYSWLVIWTTKKISVYVDDKSQPQYDETQKVSRARAFTSNKTQNRTAINDCHKDMPITRKRWFYARYDPHIDPSWTLENSELSHSVYVWWLSLQRSDGINTEKTLQKLYDIGVGTRNEKQSSKCKRCAVVGNSGNLVNSKYGKVSWWDFIYLELRILATHFEKHESVTRCLISKPHYLSSEFECKHVPIFRRAIHNLLKLYLKVQFNIFLAFIFRLTCFQNESR